MADRNAGAASLSREWDLGVCNAEISASPVVTQWVRRGGGGWVLFFVLFFLNFLCDIEFSLWFCSFLVFFSRER